MKERLLNGELNYDEHMRVSKMDLFESYYDVNNEKITENPIKLPKNQLFVSPDTVLYNNFCKPLISINNEDQDKNDRDPYIRHYKNLKKNDKILIWGLIDQIGIYHLTAQIITHDNQYYSFGFAMSSHEPITNTKKSTKINSNGKIGSFLVKLPSSVITSDVSFEYKLYRHLFNKNSEKHVKLIASSNLTDAHIIDINKYFDLFTSLEKMKCLNYIFILNKNIFFMGDRLMQIQFPIVEYKRIWIAAGHRPMGNIRKHFSEYVQQIVEETIDKNEDGTL